MSKTPAAGPFQPGTPPNYYQELIHEIDPAVNPAGVEAAMRLAHGTLDHLSREQFADEIKVARSCEQEESGFLERAASSFGMTYEYRLWRQHLAQTPETGERAAP